MKRTTTQSNGFRFPLLLLLDYDGTLTDFKRNPDHSNLTSKTRSLLFKLGKKYPVIVVTGRYAASFYKVSGLKGFSVIGTHGFEAENLPQGLRFTTPRIEKRYQKEAAQLWKVLQSLHHGYPGIHIERKPFSQALHFRGLGFSKERIDGLHRDFARIYRRTVTAKLWKMNAGKEMIEVVPRGYSKGKAVLKLLKHFPKRIPVYAGDDLSDISVLKVLPKGSLRIAVGHRVPRKHYDMRFDSPSRFMAWLERLSKA
jgi:trehalose-phosphatase